MSTVALFLVNSTLDEETIADVLVMLDADDSKVLWARKRGITLASDARLTSGTEREIAMNALRAAGFEVIAVAAQWATA
jgi:phosphomannomutase